MKLYSENKEYKLYQGSMLDMLDVIEPNSIDSIITDPPYELGFMGKNWDNSGVAFQKETWKKCFDVLKPGGHLLAFGGSRTFHKIACAIEDAGFEIRDTIMWLYGSGFPKSLNIGLAIDKKMGIDNRTGNVVKGMGNNNTTAMKNCLSKSQEFAPEYEERKAQNEWSGWGTQLKPSYEPIIVARKPVENSVIDNVMKYGVGGINIDECRVPAEEMIETGRNGRNDKSTFQASETNQENAKFQNNGRFPANVILTYDDTDYEEVCGGMPESKGASSQNNFSNGHIFRGQSLQESNTCLNGYREWYNDEGNASRYFYCAKASKFDRDEGLIGFEEKEVTSALNTKNGSGVRLDGGKTAVRCNIHPTVKPQDLMRYLVRLVSPKGATILDCFNGSGSTGKAVMLENKQYKKDYKYIGIELTEEYLPISKARIEYICNNDFDFYEDENGKEQHEVVDKSVTTLFDLEF